ncbi:RrF2 family transcriptional regulator [Ruminococcus sp.]|uniref:RrF2 family transcriptional regulator n=1 Tax=Ruminococcus sp. TaxID=41978 RepID=UPI003991926A
MKISTKVECGIIAMIDIGLNAENGEPVTVSSIAGRQNISVKYLEQILITLRQSNLVRSLKGIRGGYVTARPTDQITMREVLDALDMTILGDVNFYNAEEASPIETVLNRSLWDAMTAYLRKYSENIRLSDLIDQYKEALSDVEGPMYYI